MKILLIVSGVIALIIAFAWVVLQVNARQRARFESDNRVPKEKEGLLGFGAILSCYRGDLPRVLKLWHSNKESEQIIMAQQWEITDAESAHQTIEWLLAEGHREDYEDSFQEVKRSARPDDMDDNEWALCEKALKELSDELRFSTDEISDVRTMAAWDFERAAFVARICLFLGYLSEAEAWDYIKKAGLLSQAQFGSWKTYFASFLLGRTVAYRHDSYEMTLCGKDLLQKPSVWQDHPIDKIVIAA